MKSPRVKYYRARPTPNNISQPISAYQYSRGCIWIPDSTCFRSALPALPSPTRPRPPRLDRRMPLFAAVLRSCAPDARPFAAINEFDLPLLRLVLRTLPAILSDCVNAHDIHESDIPAWTDQCCFSVCSANEMEGC